MTTTSIQIGTRVKLSEVSRYTGTVTWVLQRPQAQTMYKIKWDNGKQGLCNAEDLEIIDEEVKEESACEGSSHF